LLERSAVSQAFAREMVRSTSPLHFLSSTEISSPIPSHNIDQLEKTDAPPIHEAYIYLLGVQYLASLCDGLIGYTIPVYNALAIQKLPGSHRARAQTRPARPVDATRIRDPARVPTSTALDAY